jgi:hypothetical protein
LVEIGSVVYSHKNLFVWNHFLNKNKIVMK